jgi:hypothetical protein
MLWQEISTPQPDELLDFAAAARRHDDFRFDLKFASAPTKEVLQC